MANFQVPQFIETKAKIIGPLTLGQFFYLAGAAALSFAAFMIFNLFFAFLLTMVFSVIGIAFAFFKVNGQELPRVFLSALNYFLKPRIYTWQRIMSEKTITIAEEDIFKMRRNMGFQEKLKDFAEKITTGKLFKRDEIKQRQAKEKFEVVRRITGEKELAKRVDYS